MEIINNLRDKMSRIALTAVLAGFLTVSLAACGGAADTASTTGTGSTAATSATATAPASSGSTDTSAGSASSGSADVQQVDAKLREWGVDLSTAQVNAGKVRFKVTNEGQFTHDLGVMDANGNEVGVTPKFKSADGAKTLEVDLKPGTYMLVCDITGHADKGMKTQLTVK